MKNKTPLQHPLAILCFSLLILLAACSPPPELTQERLDQLNCQPGDLPKEQSYESIEGRPPSLDIFTAGAPTLISTLAWNDVSSTRQSFSCTILVFEDEQVLQQALESACDELQPPYRFPNIGDQACKGGEGEVILVSRNGTFLIWIWADLNGEGIEEAANRLVDRLNR